MSRIYEALRNAESCSKSGASGRESLGAMEMPDRRIGPRWELDIELTVYGHNSDGSPFYESAQALEGNANGGLILLSVPVREGQELFLINNRTSQEQICRIVHVRIQDTQSSAVAVAFPSPHPEFWQIPELPSSNAGSPISDDCI